MTEPATTEAPRRRGWTPERRAKQAASVSQRQSQRSEQRASPERTPSGRTPTGRIRGGTMDMFWFDPSNKPPHMDYQWNVVTVLGNDQITRPTANIMFQNGWRPVPASRHPEIMGNNPSQEHIIIGGQRLDERPMEMTDEARDEDYVRAVSQVKDNFRQLQHEEHGTLPRRNRDKGSLVNVKRERPIQVQEGGGGEYDYQDGV